MYVYIYTHIHLHLYLPICIEKHKFTVIAPISVHHHRRHSSFHPFHILHMCTYLINPRVYNWSATSLNLLPSLLWCRGPAHPSLVLWNPIPGQAIILIWIPPHPIKLRYFIPGLSLGPFGSLVLQALIPHLATVALFLAWTTYLSQPHIMTFGRNFQGRNVDEKEQK